MIWVADAQDGFEFDLGLVGQQSLDDLLARVVFPIYHVC
jgi:hypothetical protein